MGEHSTAELKKQLEQATSRHHQAAQAARDARGRYEAALLEETGLSGKVVDGKTYSNPVRFIPDKIAGWNYAEVEGYVIKKDGAVGQRRARSKISDCVVVSNI